MPTIKGKVRSLNLSPKGFCESFLMSHGKHIVQINFADDAGENAAKGIKPGRTITVNAESFEDARSARRPAFSWIGQSKASYQGIVKQINYARHGEPNGAILEDGEFVHLRPGGAKAVKLKLGQKLAVEGESRTSPSGHVVIEAAVANGIELHSGKPAHRAKGKKHAA